MTQKTNQYTEEVSEIVRPDHKGQYFIDAVNENNHEKALAVAPHLGDIHGDLEQAVKQAGGNNWDDVIGIVSPDMFYLSALDVFNMAVERGNTETAVAISPEVIKLKALPAGIALAAGKGMLPVIEVFNNAGVLENPVYDELIKTAMDNATPDEIDRHSRSRVLHDISIALSNISGSQVDKFFDTYGVEVRAISDGLDVDSYVEPDLEPEPPAPQV